MAMLSFSFRFRPRTIADKASVPRAAPLRSWQTGGVWAEAPVVRPRRKNSDSWDRLRWGADDPSGRGMIRRPPLPWIVGQPAVRRKSPLARGRQSQLP